MKILSLEDTFNVSFFQNVKGKCVNSLLFIQVRLFIKTYSGITCYNNME